MHNLFAQGITTIQPKSWPTASPDCSVLDFYTHGVQSQLVSNCPLRWRATTEQVYRTPVDDMETLHGRVLQSWHELRVGDCRRAIDSINERLLAVVEHNGQQIDHLFRM